MTAAVAVGLIDGKGLPERTFCAVQHEIDVYKRQVQQCYIMTGFYTAPGDTVTIPLMKGISPEPVSYTHLEALGEIAGGGKAHQLADLRQTVAGVA